MLLLNTCTEPAIQDAYTYHLIGNNNQALKCLQRLKAPDGEEETKRLADILTYSIYLVQKKYGMIFDEIPQSTDDIALKLLRLHAKCFTSKAEIATGVSALDDLASEISSSNDNHCLFLAGRMYLIADLPEKALKMVHPATDHACNALAVHCLMAMSRYDLASKTLRRMQVADEDALLVQLTASLFFSAKGGEQLQEAFNCYEELREKYGSTAVLLNGQAAALMGMDRWDEAEALLQEAFDLDSNNEDVLVNMITIAHHFGKTDTTNRMMSRLRDCNKDHALLKDLASKDEEFTRCAQQYASSVPS